MERDVFFRHGHFFLQKKRGGSARFTMVRAHSTTLGGAARERKASGLECMHSWLTFSPPPSPSVCLAVPGIAPSGVRGGAVCGSGRARNGARRASSPARAPACAACPAGLHWLWQGRRESAAVPGALATGCASLPAQAALTHCVPGGVRVRGCADRPLVPGAELLGKDI
jgi:hypothetical protein